MMNWKHWGQQSILFMGSKAYMINVPVNITTVSCDTHTASTAITQTLCLD